VELGEVSRLAAWFASGLPTSPAPSLIHNDYKLNNVLLDPRDPRRITAVLDWEMATIGDPLSDLATMLVYWTVPHEADVMGSLASVSAQPGFPSRDELLQLYVRESGRDVALDEFNFYLAFATFKVGVICQQIYARWFNGQTHDARFAPLGDVARHLIQRAAEIAGVR
jgi:aminoglycoside phosphotransferase (APT) family kinase protein